MKVTFQKKNPVITEIFVNGQEAGRIQRITQYGYTKKMVYVGREFLGMHQNQKLTADMVKEFMEKQKQADHRTASMINEIVDMEIDVSMLFLELEAAEELTEIWCEHVRDFLNDEKNHDEKGAEHALKMAKEVKGALEKQAV